MDFTFRQEFCSLQWVKSALLCIWSTARLKLILYLPRNAKGVKGGKGGSCCLRPPRCFFLPPRASISRYGHDSTNYVRLHNSSQYVHVKATVPDHKGHPKGHDNCWVFTEIRFGFLKLWSADKRTNECPRSKCTSMWTDTGCKSDGM